MAEYHGVLPLNKPAGLTSHDCVARVRRLFGIRRVGHTGTLDPDVTGVLPICIGHATRVVEYLQEQPKAYAVVMRLGSSTTTDDASGELVEQQPVDQAMITEERVRAVFARFLGEIEQVPPMYSAIKIKGERLYKLARQGQVVERAARLVTIHELRLEEIRLGDHTDIFFYCKCSKGTYIRSLCVDLGKELGYPAHMLELTRVESGSFHISQTIPLTELEQLVERGEDPGQVLVEIGEALSFLPRVDVPPSRMSAVLNGLPTSVPHAPVGALVRLYADGQLLGIHQVCDGPKGPYAKPQKVFSYR